MSSSGLDNDAKGATKLADGQKKMVNGLGLDAGRERGEVRGEGAGKGKRRSAHYTQFAVRCEHINSLSLSLVLSPIKIMQTFI